MENWRIKEKQNRQKFEHNLPGATLQCYANLEYEIAITLAHGPSTLHETFSFCGKLSHSSNFLFHLLMCLCFHVKIMTSSKYVAYKRVQLDSTSQFIE